MAKWNDRIVCLHGNLGIILRQLSLGKSLRPGSTITAFLLWERKTKGKKVLNERLDF